MTEAWNVYADQLMPKGYGYPLYYPEQPHERTGYPARIGDVGVIEEGRFRPFFNVVVGPESGRKLPPNFQQLEIDDALRDRVNNYLSPYSNIRSESIHHCEVQGNAGTGDSVTGVGVGGKVSVKVSKERGAFVMVKDVAILDAVLSACVSFRDYMNEHERNWKEYFKSLKLDYKQTGIVLVTGVIRTSAWGLAVFSGGSVDHEINFSAPFGPFANAGAGFHYGNKTLPSKTTREGPIHFIDTGLDPQANIQAIAQRPPDTRCNQTIFLRYIKMKWRFRLLKSFEAAGSKKPDDSGDDNGSPEPEIQRTDSTTRDPLDDLLDYILDNSDADMALAGTEDILELYGQREWPPNVRSFLDHHGPKIEVVESGDIKRAYLSIEDIIIRRNTARYAYDVHMTVDHPDSSSSGSRQIDPASSSMESEEKVASQGVANGSLILARKLNDTVPDLDWPHRVFLENGTEGGAVVVMTVSPDGRFIASCYEDKAIRVWSLESEALAYRLINSMADEESSGGTIFSVAWSRDSTKLISGGNDRTGIIWDIAGNNEEILPTHILEGHDADVQTVSISPDGINAATGSIDGSVKLWRVATGKEYATIDDLGGMVMSISFSPDASLLAVSVDSTATVHNAEDGEHLVSLIGHDGLIWSLSFVSNGSRIVTSSEDHTARIWDVQTGDELVTIREHSGPVWTAAFSPDGKEVLTGSYDSSVSVCDSFTGANRLLLKDRPAIVNIATYSPGGRFIVAGCADGAVKIWQNKTGKFIAEIQGHKDKVKNIAFTPDGRKFVSSGDDGTIRIWNLVDILRVA